jgi:hypothetical protein
MICQQVGGCGLDLPPGSAHVNLESCVAALKACKVCGAEGAVAVHPRCVAHAAAQRGAQIGVSVAERRILDAVNGWLSGRSSDVGDDSEDAPRTRRKPKSGDFEP